MDWSAIGEPYSGAGAGAGSDETLRIHKVTPGASGTKNNEAAMRVDSASNAVVAD
jgi:hypothetical protein